MTFHLGPWSDEEINEVLAPRLRWPETSGVPDARVRHFRGEGIRIAVPGSGCDPAHPEFLGKTLPAGTSDSASYGTEVCSIIAGSYIGVAPDAMLEPRPILGAELTTTLRVLIEDLQLLLENPPDIVCLTLIFPADSAGSELRPIISQLVEKDVLVIAATDSDRSGIFSVPCIYPEVLSVSHCDFDGKISSHSSQGTYTEFGTTRIIPELYGYGVNVTTAKSAGGYGMGSGSGFACAYVAGVAALYAQALGIRGTALRQLLISTADPGNRLARFSLARDA